MVIGLGAGKTASRAIRELAAAVANETVENITVVPASATAESLCVELGLKLAASTEFEAIDLLLDGADEIDGALGMLKGSRGAVARERIIAAASSKRIYMVPAAKLSDRLGARASLAIAVMPFGVATTRSFIRRLGLNGVLRRDYNGGFLVTDNANLILDVDLPEGLDLRALAGDLARIPGVIDHGLFLDEADELLIEQEDGTIERRVRERDPAAPATA